MRIMAKVVLEWFELVVERHHVVDNLCQVISPRECHILEGVPARKVSVT